MAEEKKIDQPGLDLQKLIDSLMEAEPETVTVRGKERRIGWLHNGVTRRFSHVMMTEEDPWKRNVKVAACMLLNRRSGLLTWALLRFWYWLYWRWLYYVVDIDQVDIAGILLASKKKVQSEPLALAIILSTAVMDTMMTMTRHESGPAGRDGAPPTR